MLSKVWQELNYRIDVRRSCITLPDRGYKRVSEEVITDVATTIIDGSQGAVAGSSSIQGATRLLDMNFPPVWKVLGRVLLYYPYKINCLQELKHSDYGKRLTYPLLFFARMEVDDAEQFHSDANLEAVDQQAPNKSKTGNGRWKVTSVRYDRHLLHMAVNDHTTSCRQLAVRLSTATGVLMSASSIRRRLLHRGLRAKVPLYRIPLTPNRRRLHLQWVHEHRSWQADWHQVVFSDEACFNLSDHNGRCLQECVIEGHSNLTPRVMVWGVISYHGRYNLLRIECNLKATAQHMQLLPWPAYLPDMSPIKHVWDLIGRCLARDTRPTASKTNFCCAYKQYGILFHKQNIQNLFDSMPRHIATLIATLGGYTKY
ncbi:transposable element Tcb2 transposase [Trichonephila clavipes]|nr:transposable element Tcb2 transposase [Trichonephila clavipes]